MDEFGERFGVLTSAKVRYLGGRIVRRENHFAAVGEGGVSADFTFEVVLGFAVLRKLVRVVKGFF